MGVTPRAIDPLVDGPLFAQVQDLLSGMRFDIARDLQLAPMHDTYFKSGSPFAASGER